MDVSLTFSMDKIWLAIGGGFLAVFVFWFLYSRFCRWKQGRKSEEFERRERRKWEGHRLN
jgi:hypothetical protein